MPDSGSGPGCVPACQPTIAAPDLAAASNATFCSLVSKPPTTMPSGFSVSAWFIAAVRPETEPWPSITRDLPADGRGGFLDALGRAEDAAILEVAGDERRSFLPVAAFGPVVGPSHLSARAVAALAALVAMST